MQILDLSDVVFFCVVEYFQQIVRLISDCEMFPFLWFECVFSQKHRVVVGLANIGFPVALSIIEGINEFFEGFEVVEDFGVFGDEIIDLFGFCFDAIQFRD